MDDIGNIVYILFIVAMAILSIFGRKKKKGKKPVQPQQPTPSSEKEKQMTAREILTEIFGVEEEKHQFPTEESVFKPKQTIEPVVEEVIPATERGLEYELLKLKKQPKEKSKALFYKEIQSEEELRVIDLEEINWRDAIIYSEILSPKF